MRKIFIHACTVAIVVVVATAIGIDAEEPSSHERDESAIRKAAADYLDAVNRGDFDAMKARWTDNGTIVDESGRKTQIGEIRRPSGQGSANQIQPTAFVAHTDSIRFVTPNVAIEDGTSVIASASQGTSTHGRYAAVWVKRNGKWLIDSVRESAVAARKPANPLMELSWMIGDWAEEGDTSAFHASYSWGPQKHFIVSELRIQPRGAEAHVVEQRIGGDAASGTIRSWNFDSHGGFSEATWSTDGERWIASSTGVLPDGQRTRGRRIIHRIDNDAVIWESLGVEVNRESVPDLRVKLVRVPADQ